MSQSKTNVETPSPEGPESGIRGLVDAWRTDRDPFDQWVRHVSRSFFASRLRLEAAARWLRTTPAELAAVLQLATMDDAALALLDPEIPPKTTWFAFADADVRGVRAGLEALRASSSATSLYRLVDEAVRATSGPRAADRVAKLSGNIIFHMGKKAEQYRALRDKDWKALKSMGMQKKNGRPLTPLQVAYAHSLLEQLAAATVVRRESPDGDQAACDAVLDALGR